MNEGDVLLASLRQADGTIKNRPVVFLTRIPPFGDCLVCGISTQLRHEVQGLDDIVRESDEDFQLSGLRQTPLVRVGFPAVRSRDDFTGRIASISESRRNRILKNLINFLDSDIRP